MSSACDGMTRPVAIALAIVSIACGGSGSSDSDVDVAPPIIETNVGPIPGQASPAPDFEPIANPFAEDLTALGDGRRFFAQYNCAGCHGDHGGGGMGPSLRDEVWLYGGNHAQIANSIAEGRANGMPAWGTRLTKAQIWQITAYLRSMRTQHEPEPPS